MFLFTISCCKAKSTWCIIMLCIGTYGGAYGETTLSKTGQTLSNVLGELIYVFVDLLPIFVDKIKDFVSSNGGLLFSKPNNLTLLRKYNILCQAQGDVLRAIYKIRNQREQHSVFMTLSTKSFLGFDNNGFKDVLPVKCPMHPSAPRGNKNRYNVLAHWGTL
jgi:hypothetical protein